MRDRKAGKGIDLHIHWYTQLKACWSNWFRAGWQLILFAESLWPCCCLLHRYMAPIGFWIWRPSLVFILHCRHGYRRICCFLVRACFCTCEVCKMCRWLFLQSTLLSVFPHDLRELPGQQEFVQKEIQSLLLDIATWCPLTSDMCEIKNGQVQWLTSRRGKARVLAARASVELSLLQSAIQTQSWVEHKLHGDSMPSNKSAASIRTNEWDKKAPTSTQRLPAERQLDCNWDFFELSVLHPFPLLYNIVWQVLMCQNAEAPPQLYRDGPVLIKIDQSRQSQSIRCICWEWWHGPVLSPQTCLLPPAIVSRNSGEDKDQPWDTSAQKSSGLKKLPRGEWGPCLGGIFFSGHTCPALRDKSHQSAGSKRSERLVTNGPTWQTTIRRHSNCKQPMSNMLGSNLHSPHWCPRDGVLMTRSRSPTSKHWKQQLVGVGARNFQLVAWWWTTNCDKRIQFGIPQHNWGTVPWTNL